MYTTCVIWLAFVPLYFATANHVPLRITSMSVTISLSASVTIACLFSPKVNWIVLSLKLLIALKFFFSFKALHHPHSTGAQRAPKYDDGKDSSSTQHWADDVCGDANRVHKQPKTPVCHRIIV